MARSQAHAAARCKRAGGRANAYLQGVDPIALLRARVRRSSRLRETVRGLLHARLRPTALHRLLLAERSLRRSIWYELARVLYYQPLFELQCARVGGCGRLELAPESKLPFVDNCQLVLGSRWRINARTTFQGARNAPGKARIEIGDGTYLGSRVVLRAGLGIRLGRYVTVAANVVLSSDPGHPLDPVARRTQAAPLADLRQLVVEDDVWIAEGATLLGGITVGEGAIVGAHAVVTKDVPPRTVVAGNPARVVKHLDMPRLQSA
jgi:acetyltransferase-like isoleucine patch superfamily enzyme